MIYNYIHYFKNYKLYIPLFCKLMIISKIYVFIYIKFMHPYIIWKHKFTGKW